MSAEPAPATPPPAASAGAPSAAASGGPRPVRGTVTPERLAPALAEIRAIVAAEGAGAAVLAVADAGGTTGLTAFSRPGDAVTPRSRFMVASITKPLIGVAVMQLVEAAQLDLHVPVRHYLPAFAPPPAAPGEPGGEAISAWHILTHTAGLADLDAQELVRDRPGAARILELTCRRPLARAPGTAYAYVSSSFYVLGELIRRLSGEPYPAYLRRHVLAPLGMVATGFRVPLRERAAVHGFGPRRIGQRVFLEAFARRALPGGGLWSRADDLVRFGRAMLRGGELDGRRILSPASVREMTREHTAGLVDVETGGEPRYGLAWNCSGLAPGMPGSAAVFDHGGATGSRIWVDPDAGLVLVFLMNQWGAQRRFSIPAIRAIYRALGLPASAADSRPAAASS